MNPPRLRCTAVLALLLAAFASSACGGSDRSDAPQSSSSTITPSPRVTGRATTDDVATGACDQGVSRDCRVWLPESGGVKHCFVGTQVCAGGSWSACLDDQDAAELLND